MTETRQDRMANETEIVKELLDLDGRRVIDVGCGEGRFTRALAAEGAEVFGIDVNDAALAAASAAPGGENVTYMLGRGEVLPFEDASIDVVVYSNSLHHIDADKMAEALGEASRVLKPDGKLCVIEPLAEGSYFEALRLVKDETDVRAKAYEALSKAEALGLENETELRYDEPRRFKSYDIFRQRQSARGAARRAAFDARNDEIRANFLANARQEGGEFVLDQPTRVNLLRKPG
jgi:ubiquinone/menaquinone biosynthesis C-methylase UbiE